LRRGVATLFRSRPALAVFEGAVHLWAA